MNKQPSRIGLYLVLIIALVAGYFYLNNQVVSQSNYTQKQLEQALEDNKVVDAAIQQNREVPTGSVIVDTTDSGQKKVYVTDVNQAIELLNKYDIDPEIGNTNLYTYPFSRVYSISFNIGF